MRTTTEAVMQIIEVDSTLPLAPFIETANALVTEVCAPLGYDEERLELIERWLSAHFYAIQDPRTASETAGGVGAAYQYQVGLGFNVTTYGQQALRLDTKGGLASLEKVTQEGGKPKTSVSLAGDAMLRIITKMLKQIAVYWAPDGFDETGAPKFSADPVELNARWEARGEEFIDPDGTTRISKALVYVESDVAIGGKLMLGELTDLDSDQHPPEGLALEILQFEKTPTLRATQYVRKAFL